MKIIIITPPFNILKEGYGTKAKGKYGYWPPLGPGYLAASLKRAGHQVSFIDAAAENKDSDYIANYVNTVYPKIDIVMVSVLTANKDSAYELIKKIKNKNPEIPIIMGGPHATCFSEDVMKELPELDITCIGEGENTAVEIVNHIEKKISLKEIKGILFRENNTIIKTPTRDYVHNIDELPTPDWDIYDLKLYNSLPLQHKEKNILPYITSRGCPWRQCTFCFESKMGTIYRRHSPERVIEDIKKLTKIGIKEIAFWDDNFMINEIWVLKFCELLKKENINIKWQAYGRVNTVTEKMLNEASKNGCWNIFYGFETGNQDILDKIKKGATLEQAENAAKWTHKAGMDTRGSFMIALPGETPEKAMNTINFAIKMDLTYAQFLSVYPEMGTALYNDALKEGKIMKQQKYMGRMKAVYVPDGYKDAEEVEKMVKLAYRKFYFRLHYILKHLRNITSWKMLVQYFEAFKFIKGMSFT
jgi:anaerobic magnesium-protoporphyrin IX monomethyl ester cyclase